MSADASAQTTVFGHSPYLAPRLTLRVGFAGHRPPQMGPVQAGAVTPALGEVLSTLHDIATGLLIDDRHGASPVFDRTEGACLRLTSALAEGADLRAAHAARAGGWRTSFVLPSHLNAYLADQGHGARAEATARQLWNEAEQGDTRTVLECTAGEGGEPHQTVARFILDHADLLLVVWDGRAGKGPGGTAATVQEALERGLPVVRIDLEGGVFFHTSGTNAEWASLPSEAEPLRAHLAATLKLGLSVQEPDRSAQSDFDMFRAERVLAVSWNFGYDWLRFFFGHKQSLGLRLSHAETQAYELAHWAELTTDARASGGDTFADSFDRALRQRWQVADALGTHYARKFRSAFLRNYLLAAMAVFFGLLIIVSGGDETRQLETKAVLVSLELLCLGGILWTTFRGRRGRWQERWLNYRSLAEALRPARWSVLMGSSPLRATAVAGASPGERWIAWYVAASLRELPPPDGTLGLTKHQHLIEQALRCEVQPQIAYHKSKQAESAHMDHTMERMALWLLGITIVSGIVYLTGYFIVGETEVKLLKEELKPWTTFIGGVLPVFGAALFGIRATADFRSSALQSSVMIKELAGIEMRLTSIKATCSRDDLSATFGWMSKGLSDDVRLWNMIYSGRGLEAGF